MTQLTISKDRIGPRKLRFVTILDTNSIYVVFRGEEWKKGRWNAELSSFLINVRRLFSTLRFALKYLSVPFSPGFSFRRYDHVGSQDRTRGELSSIFLFLSLGSPIRMISVRRIHSSSDNERPSRMTSEIRSDFFFMIAKRCSFWIHPFVRFSSAFLFFSEYREQELVTHGYIFVPYAIRSITRHEQFQVSRNR